MESINQDLQASYNIIKLLEGANTKSDFILNSLPGVFAIINDQFEIIRGSGALAGLLATDVDGLLRRSLTELFTEESWNIFLSHVRLLNKKQSITSHVEFELNIVSSDMLSGEKAHYWYIRRLNTDNKIEGDLYIIIGEDISQLRESEKTLHDIFSSIPLGIFTIDVNGLIEDFHSVYVEHLLRQNVFRHKSVKQILFEPALERMSKEDIDGIQSVLFVLGNDEANYNMLEVFFPKLIFYPIPSLPDGGRWLKITYQPVIYEKIVKRLLLILEDRTELVKAEALRKQSQLLEDRSVKIVIQLKQADEKSLPMFMKELANVVSRLQVEMETDADYDRIYGTLHGIKGIARVAGFEFLKERVHQLETDIREANPFCVSSYLGQLREVIQDYYELESLYLALYRKNGTGDCGASRTDSTFENGELGDLFQQYCSLIATPDSLYKKFQSLQIFWGLLSYHYSFCSELEESLIAKVGQTARKLGKDVKLHFNWGNVLINNNLMATLNECLLHLLNNSVDHGIESPEKRLELNKTEVGNIFISLSEKAGMIRCEIVDDGKGIDPEVIRSKAKNKGIRPLSELVNMSDSDVLQLIMSPGFSTTDVVTDVSGRGVGLDAVARRLEEYRGGVSIYSKTGLGTTFTISVHHLGGSDLHITRKCYPMAYFKKIGSDYIQRFIKENEFDIEMVFEDGFERGIFYGDLKHIIVATVTYMGTIACRGRIKVTWRIIDDCYIVCDCVLTKLFDEKKPCDTISRTLDFSKYFIFKHRGSIHEDDQSIRLLFGYSLQAAQLPVLRIGRYKPSDSRNDETTRNRILEVAEGFKIHVKFVEDKSEADMMIYNSEVEMNQIPEARQLPGFTIASNPNAIQRDMLIGLERIIGQNNRD